jgi:hypothetical protein
VVEYCAVVLLLISSVASAQSKQGAKKTAAPKPVILSSWIRHVGLVYLDLVDKGLHADDYEIYDELLDKQERSLNIDAQGADKVFVEKVLTRVRALASARAVVRGMDKLRVYQNFSDDQRLDYAGYSVEASHYIHCKVLAEAMIDTGEAQAFGECSFNSVKAEVEIARAAETEKMRIERSDEVVNAKAAEAGRMRIERGGLPKGWTIPSSNQ